MIRIIQNLRTEGVTYEQERFVGVIEENTKELLNIMNEMLLYSGKKSVSSFFSEKEFSVRALINDATNSLNSVARERGLHTLLWIDKSVPDRLIGNADRMEYSLKKQVESLLSLIEKGEFSLKIGANSEKNLNIVLELVFKMAPFSSDGSLKEILPCHNEDPFVGLLSSCRELWDAMNGDVCLLDGKDGEVSIVVKIPFKRLGKNDILVSDSFPLGLKKDSMKTSSHTMENSPSMKSSSSDSDHNSHRSSDAPATILVVEDNPINQRVVMHLVKKLGYIGTVVNHGKAAVEILSQKNFDLILMDIQMPEMDGLEATRVIRNPNSSVLWHDVPIIAVTAHVLKSDREQCFEAGMNDHIAKPVSAEILKEKIAYWLDKLPSSEKQTL